MENQERLVLGWIDHCEHHFPGRRTFIPAWVSPNMDGVRQAESSGHIRHSSNDGDFAVYSMTDLGRAALAATYEKETA